MSLNIRYDYDCPHCEDSQKWDTDDCDYFPGGSGSVKEVCTNCGAKFIMEYEYDFNVILLHKPAPPVEEVTGLPDVIGPNQIKLFEV